MGGVDRGLLKACWVGLLVVALAGASACQRHVPVSAARPAVVRALVWHGGPPVLRAGTDVRVSFGLGASGSVSGSYLVTNAQGVIEERVSRLAFKPGTDTLTVALAGANGHPLPPGLYRLIVLVRDGTGHTVSSTARPLLDMRPVRTRVVYGVPQAHGRVALTFDDGWTYGPWRSVLRTLRRRHVPATFFVPGGRVKVFPSLARRTLAQGELIGSHTWAHVLLAGRPLAAQKAQLTADDRAWWRLMGTIPQPYLRPPDGAWDRNTLKAAGSLGFSWLVLWDVDPDRGAQVPPPRVLAARVIAQSRSGSIVVLHLIPQVAKALPRIISGLRARGLKPVRLDTLLRALPVRSGSLRQGAGAKRPARTHE